MQLNIFEFIKFNISMNLTFYETLVPTIEHRDLPQLHANSAVQLDQTCLKVHGLALWVVQVDGGALVVMTLDLPQVHSQVVTQLTEFCFTGVLQAKLKC